MFLQFPRFRLVLSVLGALAISSCAGMADLDASLFTDKNSFGQIEDVLTAMASDLWTVDGIEVKLTDDTEIEGEFRLGDMVKIEARLDEDGSAIAFEIDLIRDTNEFEFFGSVESMDGQTWMVGGRLLQITQFTEIKGPIGLGAFVKVHAFVSGEGLLTAREIELTFEEDDDGEIKFVGVVESQSDAGWWISGRFFHISESTEIEDDISEGDLVEVEALRNDDGSFLALDIEFEHDDDLEDLDDDCADDESDHDADEVCENDDDDHDDDHDDEEDDD